MNKDFLSVYFIVHVFVGVWARDNRIVIALLRSLSHLLVMRKDLDGL